MANLKSILGEFTPPLDPILASPESQFRDAMQDAGITPPDHIYMDGTLHRFQSGDKKDKTGWYILYDNVGVPAGIFGDWRTNIEQTFRANIGRKLTSSESISLS
jgi:putative DNA primase/helicase